MVQNIVFQSQAAGTVPADSSARPAPSADSAFASVAHELAALPVESLLRPTVDITRAAATALAAVPAIRSLRSEIVAALPSFPIEQLDRLEIYALAAWYADVRASDPGATARTLAAEGAPLRAELRLAAAALADRGFVEPAAIAGAGSGIGHLDVASGLLKLSTALAHVWPAIEGHTALTRERIDRATALGTELLVAVGARERLDRPAVLDRIRAFTLFMGAYDTCRRAIAAVRWREGDADRIAPSVFARRGRRKPAAAEADAGADPEASGAAGGASPEAAGTSPSPVVTTPPGETGGAPGG